MPKTNTIREIKQLMENAAAKGIVTLDIGIPVLGESTIITMKGEDFHAEKVIRQRAGAIYVSGYDSRDNRNSYLLQHFDESSLNELQRSIESALEKFFK